MVLLLCILTATTQYCAIAQQNSKKQYAGNAKQNSTNQYTANAKLNVSASYTTKDYVTTLKKVTDLMVSDVTSPVAASRYYAYISLAAYEVINQSENLSLLSTLKREKISLADLSTMQPAKNSPGTSSKPDITSSTSNISIKPPALAYTSSGFAFKSEAVFNQQKSLAALLTILKMGEKLLPSGPALRPEITLLKNQAIKNGFQGSDILFIETYVDSAVKKFISWSALDGFRALNNRLRYTPTKGDAYWQPTAPSYMAPVEPHWNKIKPFLLDSCSQYKVAAPVQYDTVLGSPFMNLVKEVYDISKKADLNEQAIAMFWDCNPFAVQQIGHVEFGLKKISPGGHWIGITGIACMQENLSIAQSALVHAILSITLADAFIACWDEKYRSNRVRPETVINRLLDPSWKPLLQTPPFPEYVSGHSVASTAAAEVLTKIFGEHYSFVDDTEVEFELPVRNFPSFNLAAAEASRSRLYGGIHFEDAIDQGILQGRSIGKLSNKIFDQHIRKIKSSTSYLSGIKE
ncbi:MAG: vanadium-dependent haloperoxidase [Flavitalea sp.]